MYKHTDTDTHSAARAGIIATLIVLAFAVLIALFM